MVVKFMFKEDNLFDILVIDSYIKCNHMSKKKFCDVCGIDESVLKKIYSQKTDVLVSDLIKISNELKIPIASLFKAEYYSKIQTRFSL